MSFQADQRAEVLYSSEQMSFECFPVLDTVPGNVGLVEVRKLSSCPPSWEADGWKVQVQVHHS